MRYLRMGTLVFCLMAGCGLFSKERSQPATEARRPPEPTARGAERGTETVFLHVAVVERPVGDPALTQEVWRFGDEQIVDLEQKSFIEENGLRICQFGELLPDSLQQLLASRRSCPEPRSFQGEPGQPTRAAIGPLRQQCTFALTSAGTPEQFAEARCQILVTPVLTEDQRVKLKLLPRVQHGKPRLDAHVAMNTDGSRRWERQMREAAEEFPQLALEVTLGPKEFVILGGRLERQDTLGATFFAPPGSAKQYLLVLRATRSEIEATAPARGPLAAQAANGVVRGLGQ